MIKFFKNTFELVFTGDYTINQQCYWRNKSFCRRSQIIIIFFELCQYYATILVIFLSSTYELIISPSLHHSKLHLTFAVSNNNLLHSHRVLSHMHIQPPWAIKKHLLNFYQIRHTNESFEVRTSETANITNDLESIWLTMVSQHPDNGWIQDYLHKNKEINRTDFQSNSVWHPVRQKSPCC